MSRASPRFTKADVARALKGATEAGFAPSSIEIMPDGSIKMSNVVGAVEPELSPYDHWKAKRGAN
jgi:hypothetical protein